MRSRVCVQANFIEWGIFIIWSPTVRNADFKESQGEPPTACYGIELLAQRHSVHPKKHEKFKSVEMWIMHVVYSMRVNVWTLCTWTHTQASCITIQTNFRKKNIRTSWLPLISSITRDCFDTCDTKKKKHRWKRSWKDPLDQNRWNPHDGGRLHHSCTVYRLILPFHEFQHSERNPSPASNTPDK